MNRRERERKLEKIKTRMEAIPSLPKGFENWIKKTVYKSSKYIFYKNKDGFCSHCGKMIHLKKATHNETGRCPNCNSKVVFKAINKAKRYYDEQVVAIVQKTKTQELVIRYFETKIYFKEWDDTSKFPKEILNTLSEPKLKLLEGSRVIITKNHIEAFEMQWDYSSGYMVWGEERERTLYFNKRLTRDYEPVVYKRNLKWLKNSEWRYSGMSELKLKKFYPEDYLLAWKKVPALEILSKMNYTNLIKEITAKMSYSNYIIEGINQRFFGLTKAQFKRAYKLNLNLKGIEMLKTLKKTNKKATDDELIYLQENDLGDYLKILEYTTVKKMINYIEKSAKDESERAVTSSVRRYYAQVWVDYIEQCLSLGFDVKNILFPKNLIDKHNEFIEIAKAQKQEKINEAIEEQYRIWNKRLEYELNDLKLVVAQNQQALIDEGNNMHNCVGSLNYAENMAKGRRIILFLRKNNLSYCTMELDPYKMEIKQLYGKRNKQPSKQALEFVERWKTKVKLGLREIA